MSSGPGHGSTQGDAHPLLDDAPCGLLQTAEDGTILRINRTFCQWVGHAAEALVGKRRFQELLTMGGRIFHQTHWSPLLRMQGTVSEVKLEFVHADGTLVPMVFNAIRRERDGAIVHDVAAFVARDRDRYERELVKARKGLEELVTQATQLHAEAKDRAVFAEQMIGIVSHDLRNPISSIMLAAEVLRQDELSSTGQRTVAAITRAADRATHLIADLLDFTRARVGAGLSVDPQPIDLHEVVAEAVDELRLVYPGRALEHVRSGDPRCTADPSRLVQLVGNLVSNAMSYGVRDAPVTVRSVGDRPAEVSIAVHNDGEPIPEESRERLFEPMTRGTHATTSGRSVGLGLFIVREIARAHGGLMGLDSAPGVGTTFTLTIPRRGGPLTSRAAATDAS